MSDCPSVIGPSTATQIVSSGWSQWSSQAANITQQALQYLQALEELNFEPIETSVDVASTASPPIYYYVPTRPDLAATELVVPEEPERAYLDAVDISGFPSAPTFNQVLPTLNYPDAPDRPTQSLGTAPTVTDQTMPTSPDTTLPTVPTMTDLSLPTVPTLDVPSFSATAPSSTGIVLPSQGFLFEDEEFTDDLLDQIKTDVSTYLEGGTGLPDAIWQQILDRTNENERRAIRARIRQAEGQWAARGFSMPGFTLLRQVEEARNEGLRLDTTRVRELAVQAAKMEVDQLRFYTQQGTAIVQFLGQMHNDEMQRAFATAQQVFESSIALFNTRLGLYQAQLQGYQVEAEVFKTRMEAALVNLELYKAQLEGQKLIGELNLQEVEIYKAQLQGVLTAVEVYKAEISAIQGLVEIDKVKIEAYRVEAMAFGERLKAYASDVNAYVAGVEGEGLKTKNYAAAADAFGSLTQAYGTEVGAEVQRRGLTISKNQLLIEEYKAKLAAWSTHIQAESTRVSTVLKSYEADVSLYATDGQIERTRVDADANRYNVTLNAALKEAELNLQKLNMDVEQAQRISALEVNRGQTVSTAYGQLASSSMSAVSLSAQVGSQVSESSGCRTQHNYEH